jgi:Protein of unknown function (DUF3551)
VARDRGQAPRGCGDVARSQSNNNKQPFLAILDYPRGVFETDRWSRRRLSSAALPTPPNRSLDQRRLAMKITRTVLILLAACPLTGIDARPSEAEIYRPWCVVYSGRDGARTCSFSSFEQCMMTATPGTGGSCVQNTWYSWYGPTDSSARPRRGRP